MKTIKIKHLLLVLVSFIFLSSTPPEKYPIWYLKPNGDYQTLWLNEQAALMHLAHHEGDWCHPGHCPWN